MSVTPLPHTNSARVHLDLLSQSNLATKKRGIYQSKMIWMNNELRETETVVLERVFHVRGYDHFVICEPFESTPYQFSDGGSRSVGADKVSARELPCPFWSITHRRHGASVILQA